MTLSYLAAAATAVLAYLALDTRLHGARTGRRAFWTAVAAALGWAVAAALPRLDAWWLVASAVSVAGRVPTTPCRGRGWSEGGRGRGAASAPVSAAAPAASAGARRRWRRRGMH